MKNKFQAAPLSVTAGDTVVIKIGSSTLTVNGRKIDHDFLGFIADQIAQIHAFGVRCVIVTSGAIACGLEALGVKERPQDIPSLQASASVGQSVLASVWATTFSRYDILTSLVLLTRRDTADRKAYLHARDTLTRLLEMGVIPIVNENDTVSVEQIRFGDNDTLAALVACLVDAEQVIILSDIDGLFDANPALSKDAKLIGEVHAITPSVLEAAGGPVTKIGSGGMVTKLQAARVLMAAGIPLVVCNGHTEDCLLRALSDTPVGTRFIAAANKHEITPKKLWIALGDISHGSIFVDNGAKQALISNGSSLLPVGCTGVEGVFDRDDIVDIKDACGFVFARGKVAFSNKEVESICGRCSEDLLSDARCAPLADKPIIHRDDLIIFE